MEKHHMENCLTKFPITHICVYFVIYILLLLMHKNVQNVILEYLHVSFWNILKDKNDIAS